MESECIIVYKGKQSSQISAWLEWRLPPPRWERVNCRPRKSGSILTPYTYQ